MHQNPNLYNYTKNPWHWVDPLGLTCKKAQRKEWNKARRDYWKNKHTQEIANPTGKYSKNNLDRMKKGKAPRIKAEVYVNKTGKKVTKDFSIELHHKDIPQRVGGVGVNDPSNLIEVTPWEHEAIDEFRHTGSELKEIIEGTSTW